MRAVQVEREGEGARFRLCFADAAEFVDVYGRQIAARKLFMPFEKIGDLSVGEGCVVEVRLPGGSEVFWLECRIEALETGRPRGVALELAALSPEMITAIEAYITELVRGETPTTELPAGSEPTLPGEGGELEVDRDGDAALAFQEEATGRAQDGRSIQAQLREMSHAERIRLALTGGKAARAALIRNPQPVYHPYVVQNPRITKAELAAMAKNPNLAPEALRQIAANAQFMSDPQIRLAVVRNPKTDAQIAQKFLARLPQAQLRQLARSDDVRPNIKAAAVRLLSRSG